MPRKTTPQLAEAVGEYMLIRSTTCAKNTVANDGALLRKFAAEIGPSKQVHLVQPRDVEVWFAKVSQVQRASSFNKVRQRVRGFFKFCISRGWIESDPSSQVGTRQIQETDKLRLTAAQLIELIEGTDNPRDRGMLALAANTGLRAGDVTSLHIGDVDLERGELTVHVQKTGRIDRLPITQDLDQELRIWLSWYAERLAYIGQALEPGHLLFPAMGFRNVRRNGVVQSWGDPEPDHQLRHPARVVQRALLRIGIEETKSTGFHTIRRSVGRVMFDSLTESGHDSALRLTASLLGHKNVATTELYLGVSADRQKRDDYLRGRSLLGQKPANATPIRSVQ